MKKLLMTLIVALAFGGSIYAQHPDSYWSDFNQADYEMQGALYASFAINGVPVTNETENWDVLEIAAFVTIEEVEILRGQNIFLTDKYLEYGELFPTSDADPIYYTTPGDAVHFKMHNHATDVDYNECHAYIWPDMENEITIATGEEHWEGFDDPEHPLILNFVGEEPEPATFTKTILGWNEVEGQGRFYLISTPIKNANPEAVGMYTYDYDLYMFDQTGDDEGKEWINQKSNPDEFLTLPFGKGYLYASAETVDLTFTGTPWEGDEAQFALEFDPDLDPETSFQGFNLVGNPFGEDIAYCSHDYYIMNEAGTTIVPSTPEYEIQPMEGIFVIAESEQDVVMFTKQAPNPTGKLAINMSNGNNSLIDRAIIRFEESRQLPKFQLNENSSKIYFNQNNRDYAIVSSNGQSEMPLNFKAETTGTYTFSFNTDNVNFDYLRLIDRLTGESVDLLTSNSYEFVGSPRDNENRFIVSFSQNAGSDIFAYQNDNDIVVNGEGELQVFDVMGRFVGSYQVNGNEHISASTFSTGVYIFRLIGNDTKTQKIVVR